MDCNLASAGGHHHIIVVVDYFTKWDEAMPTVKSDSETAAQPNYYSFRDSERACH